jgi:hypothetical protein
MPLAALTPVLKDLQRGNASNYPQRQSLISSSNDSPIASEYRRKSSALSNQLPTSSSIDEVSIFINYIYSPNYNEG